MEQAARGESVRVFLSHTTRDERDHLLAQKLAAALRARDVEVWIAPESIPAGERWKEGIVAGIMRSCSHLLVILSAASIEADDWASLCSACWQPVASKRLMVPGPGRAVCRCRRA